MDPFQVPARLEVQDALSCSGGGQDQVEVLALVCTAVADACTMCAALCTSSSARQAILAKCSGGLQLQLKPEVNNPNAITATAALAAVRRLLQQAAWLEQYGGLVGQLQLQSAAGSMPADEMAWNLRPPLQLRCLQLQVSRPVPLLKQLDPGRLTRLELIFTTGYIVLPPVLPAALDRLTGLQQLVLTGSWAALHDSTAAALAGMPQLTLLVLQPHLPAAAMAQLPSQLVELQLGNSNYEAAQLMADVQALQQLQSLTLLYDIAHTGFAPAQHAEAWASFPQLKRLDIEEGGSHETQLRADLAAGIAAATCLTRLYGGFGRYSPDVDLLAMLSPLKHLHSLQLELALLHDVPLQSFRRLFSRDLTQLRSLALDIAGLSELAIAQVCLQATQLTELMLCCDALKDDNVVMIAENMAELQRLALAGRPQLNILTSAGVRSALAPPNLPRLQQLALCNIMTVQQQACLISTFSLIRPSVRGFVVASREDIPSGFVGAYCYPDPE